MIFLVLLFLCAFIAAPLLAETAAKINIPLRAKPPFELENGLLYVLGSDNLGRSLLARIVYASQHTLMIAFCAVFFALLVGGGLGVWAGYRGGWVATLIMRFTDALMSFPLLLLSILLLYIMQAQGSTIVLVLAISRVPLLLRVARGEALKVRERLYVTAAKTMNVPERAILFWHIVPGILPTLLTFAALEIAAVMLAESSLSFIGLGVQAPELSWGTLVSQGSQYIVSAWWLVTFPGLMIVLTALANNLVIAWFRNRMGPQ